ncbi:hypothetical protein EVB81_146 [Rhizobium phage RHph_I46]|uniref:Uncharacterized protein n=1 Tax=Rhizobium phage RHph_I1_9 TaxID=2509729 RepID=A0A7S5R9P2_9CAUD|nr:hypothetical protein PP936_gp145 [Rhizobium phage RHph_I1_9]QIG69715.1 hypothetical protein EVB81_146 [Rhizobium phage RHph_I46]QIG70996.1 hypothetical protein EVB92_146 [Rhizobium phage RHph_I9]QIG73582.1 hypothetical protein EVC04_145 [Rhizobium phage RHph_I1_9]QIG76335.1 hypothetical protein EVC25_146 [Rhizobium phage RHph_I34]
MDISSHNVLIDQGFVVKGEPTFTYEICMAGDINHAKQIVRQYCFEVGLCVTIDPTTYIYTGGEEEGFKIRLIHYPRFPPDRLEIRKKAAILGVRLAYALSQTSFSIVGDDNTYWFTRRPYDLKQAQEK